MKTLTYHSFALRNSLIVLVLLCSCSEPAHSPKTLSGPHPVNNPNSPLMLAADWVPEDVHQIDFANLPQIPSLHTIVSDVREAEGVNQHNYLAYHDGRYWIMWSDGPGKEDRVGQVVKFSNSDDGVNWDTPRFLTPYPPGAKPDSEYYGVRSDKGLRWIARGFWQPDGELLAIVSLDEAGKFFGPSLQLMLFRWDSETLAWDEAGVLADNAINNFPPKRLPTGEWMTSRRTHDYKDTGVQFLVGGVEGLDQWSSFPVLKESDLDAEEPYWWVLPDNNLMALFRDNNRSGYLFRSFSIDNGRTWNTPVRTNFPDARSKFHGIRMSDGRYALVSNVNPHQRDPLALSISDDGIIFNQMGYLVGGRNVNYPHMMEHDGHLLIAYAGDKRTVEVLKIRLEDVRNIQNMAAASK